MRALLVLFVLAPWQGYAATLNKCTDENGVVTYTNLKCAKSQTTRKIELDPPPLVERPRGQWQWVATPPPAAAPVPQPSPTTPPAPAMPATTEPAPPVAAVPARAPTPKLEFTPSLPARTAADAAPPRRPAMADSVCEVLAQQIGEILDRMDAARHDASEAHMNAWQTQIKALEARKQVSNCF